MTHSKHVIVSRTGKVTSPMYNLDLLDLNMLDLDILIQRGELSLMRDGSVRIGGRTI
jgi:hypothetical protein